MKFHSCGKMSSNDSPPSGATMKLTFVVFSGNVSLTSCRDTYSDLCPATDESE